MASERIHAPNVGAPDPELKSSPIFDHDAEEFEYADLELETGCCYFNNKAYPVGDFVCSGDELLRCEERGIWVRVGTCENR